MSGICGIFDLKRKGRIKDNSILRNMIGTLRHRDQEKSGDYIDGDIALAFTKSNIPEGEMQPIFNEHGTLVMICDGEIYNYVELHQDLVSRGHQFKTPSSDEVILHLYEEDEMEFLNRLDGQFAFALFDLRKKRFICANDHFGVMPFFYTTANDFFVFGSEIKAILKHPDVKKEVDLVGLDQILTFPGLVFPRTMFKNIRNMANANYLTVDDSGNIITVEYWDAVYPRINEVDYKSEDYYIEKLDELMTKAVRLRLKPDVPLGVYISGGLDSAVVAAIVRELAPTVDLYSYAIDFEEKERSEVEYQRIMADFIDSIHNEHLFLYPDVSERLRKVVYHTECPLKETYDTAMYALSEHAFADDVKTVLNGEGADVFFGGLPGFKFDKLWQTIGKEVTPDTAYEEDINQALWGDKDFKYEKHLFAFGKVKKDLFSKGVNEIYDREIDCLQYKIVDKAMLKERNIVDRRSYVEYKLRTALVSDHTDRMARANSVDARYPFISKELVEFTITMPPFLKLNDFDEKYALKQIAQHRIPDEIVKREKFAFHSPGSPYLLKRKNEYINDLISYEKIKRLGYFNPDTVERLKKQYTAEGFVLNIPFEADLLITVITFGMFLEEFGLEGRGI